MKNAFKSLLLAITMMMTGVVAFAQVTTASLGGRIVDTYGTAKNGLKDGEIANKVSELFDLRPAKIIRKFGLKNPIYTPTASYGHMGRTPYTKAVTVQGKSRIVQFFGWELLDSVPAVKEAFGL